MTPARPRTVLISGGGIAGCTLAYFLERFGFSPTVVESADEFKRVGYALALNRHTGQRGAEQMGVLEALQGFEIPVTKNLWCDMRGRLLRGTSSIAIRTPRSPVCS